MERLNKVVLEVPQDMHYEAAIGEEGELILRVVPNSSEISCDKAKYFTQITAEDREKVKNWLAKQKGENEKEEKFLAIVKTAVKAVNYDYWIANLEPSVTDGKIYYAEGNAVGVGFSYNQWMNMAEEYAPERGSRLSNEYELFIWYALRIVNNMWTLNYVATNSSGAGNYSNAPGATQFMEKTGERNVGGYCDGQGNSYKMITYVGGCRYGLAGGLYRDSGYECPVADIAFRFNQDEIRIDSSGVLVLTK